MKKRAASPTPPPGPAALSGGLASLHVDTLSSQPIYLQLQHQIEALMSSGQLASGMSLPAERVLAEALGISRTTVKRCYDELRNSQILSTHGRGGTMVQKPPQVSPEMGRLKGFSEEMRELGMTPSSQVIEQEAINDRTMASIFQRPSTALLLRLVRVRLGDDIPMSREVAWYDLTLAPALAHWNKEGSAYDFLQQQCQIELGWAEQTIEAVLSSATEAAVFGFEQPSPCLLIKRRSYSTQGQLVEYVEGCFRGDAYSYRLKLKT